MPWMSIAATVGAQVVGGMMASDSSEKASQAQTQSSDAAIAEQRRQYDLARGDQLAQLARSRSDNSQFLNTGTAANRRLAQLLGISAGAGSVDRSRFETAIDRGAAPTREQFMRGGGSSQEMWQGPDGTWSTQYYENPTNAKQAGDGVYFPGQVRSGGEFDEAGYNAALERWNSGGGTRFDQAGYDAAVAQAQGDASAPDYGSLLRAGPAMRNITGADIEADPVYKAGLKFGEDQGRDSINARALQMGNYDSGATLKALTRFSSDYGSQKAGDAYNRMRSADTEGYNRFQTDQGNVFNRLSGVSGTGQVASNQVGSAGSSATNAITSAGSNATNQITDLITGAGNARAAGIVGGSNAWGNSINSGINNYQSNKLLERLMPRTSASSYVPPVYGSGGGIGDASGYQWSDGGKVSGPGTGTSDSIQARVSNGEFIIPADVVRAKGSKFFRKLIAEHHNAS